MEGTDDGIFDDLIILEENELRRERRKRKIYKGRINPFVHYSDADFVNLYRFYKNVSKVIVDEIRSDLDLRPQTRGRPISAEIMVMATIRYLAKGSYRYLAKRSYQKDIADAHGISQQSMTGIIRKVVSCIAARRDTCIKFLFDRSELQRVKEGFYNIARFPQCIGEIDCTHIKIKNPGGEFGGRPRCRKGFYSINVQVICNSKCEIMDIVARWRGSVHDSRIWRNSVIKSRLEKSNLYGGVILGDNGYPCSRVLLTPFLISRNLSPAERRYNVAHIATRNRIEHLFRQLKNKFRCCLNGILVNLETAKNIIIAIAILHSIARANETHFIEEGETAEDTEIDEENIIQNTRGSDFRQQFINKYFN